MEHPYFQVECANHQQLELRTNGDFVLHSSGKAWVFRSGSQSYAVINSGLNDEALPFGRFQSVQCCKWVTGFGDGLKITYTGTTGIGETGILSLETAIWVDRARGDLHCELEVLQDEAHSIREVAWPPPIVFDKIDAQCYTVLPMMQGCIIPNNWPEPIVPIGSGLFYSRDAYMPWWGQVEYGAGYLAIAETPWDGGYRLDHEANESTSIGAVWYPSLGKFTYRRKMRYSFFGACDYNTLCRAYRKYIDEKGGLSTLQEKCARNPLISQLIGSPVIHTSIYYHIEPTSSYYNADDPGGNDNLVTFEERGRQLRRLKALGLDKAYVHLDGWGVRGYDNKHPDVLPPCEKAGGFKGMSDLSLTCKEIGYIFAIHDQYRDYYLDAENYDEGQAVQKEDGSVHYESVWYGGKQTILCAQFAPHYIRRNFKALQDNGVILAGAYLDVFSVVELDECFAAGHRMTRRECMEVRTECFNLVRAEGLVISSEEPLDWSAPTLDLVHHAPHALYPTIDRGRARGIPVPLFNLVYHDCMVIPWGLAEKGGWGIPDDASGFLFALLNGGTGYLDIDANAEELARVNIVLSLHRKVAFAQMTSHEFVGGNNHRQRTVFSNGVTVEVDFGTGEYLIRG